MGPRKLLGTVGARVGDGARGLRGEQQQDLLVFTGELLPALLAGEVEVADVHAAMTHRRTLEDPTRQPVRGEAERAHVGGEIGEPQWSWQVAEVLE